MEKIKLDLVEEEVAPNLYMSVPKKKIPIPKVPFEKFINKFKTYEEVMKTKEWADIYSNYYSFNDEEKQVLINENKEDLEAYSYERQLEELKKCAKSFTYFCLKYAKISHPTFGIINFIPYNYQKRVLECYGKHRFNILSKFRQGGLTTVSVAWALWRCIFKTSQKIMVVSKTDREAITAGSIAKTILDYLPDWLKPKMEEDNKHEKHFKDTTSSLCFYTVEAARGRSITILIIDEAAFIKDMDEHWKALYPVISTGGAVAMISTVNGIGNCYHTIYSEAEAGKNPFNIIEMDYWEHPLYNDPKWIKDTYEVLGDKGWKQEIERSFLGSGETWLNSLLVKELYENTRNKEPKRQAFAEYKKKILEVIK